VINKFTKNRFIFPVFLALSLEIKGVLKKLIAFEITMHQRIRAVARLRYRP